MLGINYKNGLGAAKAWCAKKIRTFFVLPLLAVIFSSNAFALETTVTLQDFSSQEKLSNQTIKAYLINESGSHSYVSSKTTDALGQATFELDTDSGQQYVLKTYALGSIPSISTTISTQTNYLFDIGKVTLFLKDGNAGNGSSMTNHKVSVQVEKEPGKFAYYASGYSDDNGELRFDLPGLDTGTVYRLYSKTSQTNVTKYSAAISSIGEHNFTIGNLPLALTIKDALTGELFVNSRVDYYRLTADNKHHWAGRHTTDANGVALLDLDPLDTEQGYVAQIKAFGTYFKSNLLPNNGSEELLVGTSKITVKNGAVDGQPVIAGKSVTFYKVSAEGKKQWYGRVKSDDEGAVRINLKDIDNGQTYQASAQSEVASNYYSVALTKSGESTFVVGFKPLVVSLFDATTEQAIANTSVTVYQLDENNKRHWHYRSSTDESGQVSFDLAGLQEGKQYQLSAKVYNNAYAYSGVVSSTGDFDFPVGREVLTFLDGSIDSTPVLANTTVTFYKMSGTKKVWYTRISTDDSGVIKTDLSDIGPDQTYVASIKSSVNGSTKYSQPFNAQGANTITIGDPAVNVTLSNSLTGELYVDTSVTAYRIDESGKKHWYQRQSTDESGVVAFDLDGIKNGQQYKFSANVFGTGYAYSDVVSSPGDIDFQVGGLPITLLDRDTQQPLANKKVYVYRINEQNRLEWKIRGNTSDVGDVTFDVEGLGNGDRFVLKAYDVFSEGKYYYGPVIASKGHVQFNVKKGEGLTLDLQDPTIDIVLPEDDIANSQGFSLSGIASDNEGINLITVSTAGQDDIQATLTTLSPGRVEWLAEIPGEWLTADTEITLSVTAFDYALNDAEATKTFTAKQDEQDPTIVITSHEEGNSVNVTGFTIEGEVSDDIEVQSIVAQLNDPLLGSTIVDRNVLFNPATGLWAMTVTNGKVSLNQTVTLSFVVTDTSGKNSQTSISLLTEEVSQNPLTLVNRITFGLTPDLLARVKRGDDILAEQLDENSLDDSVLEAELALSSVNSLDDLRSQQIYRMIRANKQLREVMTWFWENHFNTNFNTHQEVAFEVAENNAFRSNALGNFADLLIASAKSPAMLHYLNNQQNQVGRPNENYAREVMELHTLGVDGGYSASDIAELAKIFTGWQEDNGEFSFNQNDHDFSDKNVLGVDYSGTGVEEGEQALRDLAVHPSTANYLCSKLVAFFVSEFGNNNLQNQCAAEYLSQQGDIKSTLQVLFNSQAFAEAQVARENVKTPVEMLIAIARNFNAEVNPEDTHTALVQLGQSLFTYPVPTGYSESAADWLNSNAILQRLRVTNEVVWQQSHGLSVSLTDLLISQGVDTPEAIVSYLADIAYGGLLTELELNTFVEILNDEEVFDIQANEANSKLQRLLASMIAAPAYQMQ